MDPVTAIDLFVCGDIMTGRGIDQILPHPAPPTLYEPYVRDARDYVALAEARNGSIPREADPLYPWGDALTVLSARTPAVRIVNLETAVTRRGEPWPGKGIHYRMSPDHVLLLKAAGVDCVSLANNHVLDWGYAGLDDTLEALVVAGIHAAGAGRDALAAWAPVLLEVPGKGRVVVFAVGFPSSGIPPAWAASRDGAGVNLLAEDPDVAVREVGRRVRAARRPGDVVVISVHWGGNWGFRIPLWQQELAHRLIDESGADLVHGHSSHHPKGIEVHRGKLILYGCGDFINDYEGIQGYEEFRGELSLMYFPTMDPVSGDLVALQMCPARMKRFRVRRAAPSEARWLQEVLAREGRALGTDAELTEEGDLVLRWGQ